MGDRILSRCKAITQEDKWWFKILLGALSCFIPPIAIGYLMEMIDDVRQGREVRLPEWQNISKMFMNGLPLAIFSLVLGIVVMALNSIPLLGQLVIFVVTFLFPAVLVIMGYRMLETADWKEAVNLGILLDVLQKKKDRLLPILVGNIIGTLLIMAAAMILSITVILFPVALLATPPACFFLATVIFPMLAEVVHTDAALEDATEEPPAAPAVSQTPEQAVEQDQTVQSSQPQEAASPASEKPAPKETPDEPPEDTSKAAAPAASEGSGEGSDDDSLDETQRLNRPVS